MFQVRPISHQAVFNTNAYIMLYELECPPFPPKTQSNGTSSKMKVAPAAAVTATSSATSSNNNVYTSTNHTDNNVKENSAPSTNNKLKLNGSRVVYGPELPPKMEITAIPSVAVGAPSTSTALNQNGIVSSSNSKGDNRTKLNGNSSSSYQNVLPSLSSSSSSSSSDSESETQQEKDLNHGGVLCHKTNSNNNNVKDTNTTFETTKVSAFSENQKNKSAKTFTYRTSSSASSQDVNSSNSFPQSRTCFPTNASSLSKGNKENGCSSKTSETLTLNQSTATTPNNNNNGQSLTKLVPYDVDDDDDENSSSEEFEKNTSPSSQGNNRTGNATTFATRAVNPSPISNDRIVTKATSADWQVTSSTDHGAHEPSNEGKKKTSKINTFLVCFHIKKILEYNSQFSNVMGRGRGLPIQGLNYLKYVNPRVGETSIC